MRYLFRLPWMLGLLLMVLPSFWTELHAQPVSMVHGHVYDAVTGEDLVGAHARIAGRSTGAVSDAYGQFVLAVPKGEYTLQVTHVGYQVVQRSVSGKGESEIHHIAMHPELLPGEELVVTAGRSPAAYSGLYADVKTRPVEDHLNDISGVDLVSRTNFAKDPVIRGQRNGRVEILIDGMRMAPACVDGMDPLTAYLEADNLEAIQISRGPGEAQSGAGTTGGGINFQMTRPPESAGMSGSVESGYQTVSRQNAWQTEIGYGRDNWAIRLSGSYRKAGDMRAGSGEKIDGSSLRKGNIYLAGSWKPASGRTVLVRYMGDFAGFIGYPALLMDTRRADAHLTGLSYEVDQPFRGVASMKSTLYASQVVHRMDDYRRDPSDRTVMKDMYMPMDGQTRTVGVRSEMTLLPGSAIMKLQLESWLQQAAGDMRMIPTDPVLSEMRVINLGDALTHHTRFSTDYMQLFDSGWRVGGNLQAEVGINRLRDPSARAIYRAELPSGTELEPETVTWLAAARMERDISAGWTMGVRLSHGTRQPDHMERYGYYIYQPLDGYFYLGNPGLKPERSRQAELFLLFGGLGSKVSGRAAFWANHLDSYISGERLDTGFKRMANMGEALLIGVEVELEADLQGPWSVNTQLAWTRGDHIELGEPLPMIPPLKGITGLLWQSAGFGVEGRVRWASPQTRTASRNHLEEKTDGYAMVDFYTRFPIRDHLRIQIGMENILDGYHADHLSVNSFPEPGRNLQVSVKWAFR
ncbi:MAG: TonB-dependent receptor [Balneolaceae bacterium]